MSTPSNAIPFQWPININPNKVAPPRISFDPNPLGPPNQQVAPKDNIFWTNNDSQPHWPGLSDKDGNILNKTYFMLNQIAANSSSDAFAVTETGTMYYACSLHPDEKSAVGKIEVSSPKP